MPDSPSNPARTPDCPMVWEDGVLVLRPFADEPGRWDDERQRHLGELHAPASGNRQATPASRAALRQVDEFTDWGWMRWQIPAPGHGVPQSPTAIGVLPPAPSRTARLSRRWLTRRRGSWRLFGLSVPVVLAAVLGFLIGLRLLAHNVPLGVVLPAALLVPVLAAALPDWLETVARRRVRLVDSAPQLPPLQRMVILHARIARAAARAPIHDLQHATRIGHRVLWHSAGLLTARPQDQTGSGTSLATFEQGLSALALQATDTASAWQDLQHAIADPASTPQPADQQPHTPTPPAQQDQPSNEILADTTATLGDLTTTHRYAAALLTVLARSPR